MPCSFLEAYLPIVDVFLASLKVFHVHFIFFSNSEYLKYSEVCAAVHKNDTFLL